MLEQQRPDGVWVGLVEPSDYADYEGELSVAPRREYCRGRGGWQKQFMRRNYELFAILGGYSYNSGSYAQPISLPRGIPLDASQEYTEYAAAMGVDGHSHSWLTLREILAYPWSEEQKHHCFDFLTYTIPYMQALGTDKEKGLRELGGPDFVRACFFFDN